MGLLNTHQNNFTLAEFVANRKAELDFEPVKNKVLKMQWEYNKQLVESAKTTTGKGGSAWSAEIWEGSDLRHASHNNSRGGPFDCLFTYVV